MRITFYFSTNLVLPSRSFWDGILDSQEPRFEKSVYSTLKNLPRRLRKLFKRIKHVEFCFCVFLLSSLLFQTFFPRCLAYRIFWMNLIDSFETYMKYLKFTKIFFLCVCTPITYYTINNGEAYCVMVPISPSCIFPSIFVTFIQKIEETRINEPSKITRKQYRTGGITGFIRTETICAVTLCYKYIQHKILYQIFYSYPNLV